MKKVILIVILLLVAGVVIAIINTDTSDVRTDSPSIDDRMPTNSEKFRGTITAYSTSCFADGICSVTVDDKMVVTTIGFRADKEVGRLIGVESIGDLENEIGSEAEVYALKQDDGTYTLYGDNRYYVLVYKGDVIGPKATTTSACYVGGCSSQVCSDRNDIASTCEWKEEYACYKTATCERQSNGTCGWTPSAGLTMCLEKAR